MTLINTTNLTSANTVYDIAIAVDQLSLGLLGIFLVIGLIAVAFLAMATRGNRFSASLLTALWMGSIMGTVLFATGLFDVGYLTILIIITGAMTFIVSFGN